MSVEHTVIALVIILGLSLIARPISRWLHLPYASILVLLGFLASELIIFFGIDTGIRADNFQSLVFYVFIPILVFESAYHIDKQALRSNLVVILSLAIIGMLFTCGISAALLYYGIGHGSGFPWLAALITGAILAATDPVAVVDKLKEVAAPKRIGILLEGESLFNDATAIVLFSLFISMATAIASGTTEMTADLRTIYAALLSFVKIFFGGVVTGLLVGLVAGRLKNISHTSLADGVMSLFTAYGSYLLAESLMFSGVVSTLLAALVYSVNTHQNVNVEEEGNDYLWDFLSHVASVSVFIIVGAVITLNMFEQRWLAILIAIIAILFARIISTFTVLSLFSFSDRHKVPLSAQAILVWGGLRGAVTLALALSLPTSLDYWWTIQSIAFGVVVFSLFVQAPTMALLIRRLLH